MGVRVDSIDIDKRGAPEPVVVLAADENFAMPLAATVRSVLDHLASDRKLRVFVLDGGITDATKDRLVRSWSDERCQVTWLNVAPSLLGCVPISGHASAANYYRILMPRLLPMDVTRAIYLDADLIVRHDLAELWECDLGERLCLAAQDCAAPYL